MRTRSNGSHVACRRGDTIRNLPPGAPLVWRRRVIEHVRAFASLDTAEFLNSATLVGEASGIYFFGIANCPQSPLAFLPGCQDVGVAHPVMGQISQFMGVLRQVE